MVAQSRELEIVEQEIRAPRQRAVRVLAAFLLFENLATLALAYTVARDQVVALACTTLVFAAAPLALSKRHPHAPLTRHVLAAALLAVACLAVALADGRAHSDLLPLAVLLLLFACKDRNVFVTAAIVVGTIQVESTVGEGTRFIIRIPIDGRQALLAA